ncbi:MAG: MCE family protein [Alphaproteobacteria bacterium]|nr:MAG: MCE family protein [Alphaproteobacteria bacterium]
MEKSAHYFLVGLFVSLAIFFLFGFLIWLAGPHDKNDYNFYTVEFTDSISGLEEGASVQYHGVKVGKVMKMTMAPECFNLVRVDIGVDKQTPVREHTRVALETQGITGLVRLEMSTEDSDTKEPVRREGLKYPVLQGSGSQLYKALEDIPVITAQVRDITKKLDGLMDDQTMASMRATVANIENMTKDLNGLLTSGNVGNATLLLNNLSVSSAQMPEIMDHFKKASYQIDAASASVNSMLRRNRQSIDHFASEGLTQITAASREIKGTASSARKLADKLEENPSQLLYQPSAHGVEIPK